MSPTIRAMRKEEADQVAEMVKHLARDIGAKAVPNLTGEALATNRHLVDVVVAEGGGHLIGACLSLMTFSTWRGVPGAYIVDLFVRDEARGHNVGELLLKASAARAAARGACFIKLEVDRTNLGAVRFYERLGFAPKDDDRLFVLEPDRLAQWLK
jgi:ribosomal protein S18 acetylase RimI-like enzyme